MTDSVLVGKDVLLLEDEVFVNMAAAQELQDAGCGVRAFFTIEDANGSVDERLPDAAVLDVNIGGTMSYPVAERLAQAGIPFVFFTSYDRSVLPEPWSQFPICQKAAAAGTLETVLKRALANQAS
jgi:DNA-binding NtrC family response regulator